MYHVRLIIPSPSISMKLDITIHCCLSLGLLESRPRHVRVAATGHHQWTGPAASFTKTIKLILYVCVCVSCYYLSLLYVCLSLFFFKHARVWVIFLSFH